MTKGTKYLTANGSYGIKSILVVLKQSFRKYSTSAAGVPLFMYVQSIGTSNSESFRCSKFPIF